MPIYEYECGTCGRYEVLQKITEPALKRCEKCRAPVRKLVSQSSFTLKGGGWYKDLYSKPAAEKSNGKSSEGGSSASTPSSPTPSASKSDGKSTEAAKPADGTKKKKAESKSAAA